MTDAMILTLLGVGISLLSLGIAATTMYFTWLRRGRLTMTKPTLVFFGHGSPMIALEDKVGNVDSYGVVFDPKLKGKTAMEDAWINSAIFTAIYLKNSENAKIAEPGNLTPDELGVVMEFLIKHKKDGQFRTFWSGWEQGVQLVANQEVYVMTGWEPIVYAARERGIKAYYAVPKEGYEGWGNNTVLLKGAVDRGLSDIKEGRVPVGRGSLSAELTRRAASRREDKRIIRF